MKLQGVDDDVPEEPGSCVGQASANAKDEVIFEAKPFPFASHSSQFGEGKICKRPQPTAVFFASAEKPLDFRQMNLRVLLPSYWW